MRVRPRMAREAWSYAARGSEGLMGLVEAPAAKQRKSNMSMGSSVRHAGRHHPRHLRAVGVGKL